MFSAEQLQGLAKNLTALGTRRLVALGIVGLSVFGVIALGGYVVSRPEFETMYIGLNQQDVGRMGAVLNEAGLTFDVSPDGAKMFIRRGQAAQARMLLAERGLPASSSAGYELFDKLGPMGLTSFMQEVTRLRAMEGEIARSIQTMRGVKAARVHIVLPDQGSFRRAKQSASASVIVRTDSTPEFAAGNAIRHLVSAAVPGLSADEVRVLTTDGTVLAAGGGDAVGGAPQRMVELEKSVAREVQENVRRTLAPYLGVSNFEASVSVKLNIDKRQTNETNFDPDTKVERSLRVVRETGSAQNAGGRSGISVDQNVPGEQNGTQGGEQSRKANERREQLTNFEMNSRSTSTISEGYRIENLGVAVVINAKRLSESVGPNATPEAIAARIKEIERLVAASAGIESKRGDQVTVAAVDFPAGAAALAPTLGESVTERLMSHTGSAVKAVAVIVMTLAFIFLGLKPAIRAVLAEPQPRTVPTLAAPSAGPQALGAVGAPFSSLEQQRATPESKAKLRLEQLVASQQEQAVAVLRQWVRNP